MTRFFYLCSIALVVFLGVAVLTASPQGSPRTETQVPTPIAVAEYVGTETCLGCHEGLDRAINQTVHGKAAHPRSPAAAQGCESCHGPGSRHIEDPADDTAIRKFTRMAPRDVGETCLTCHTKTPHTMWEGSAHDARN